MKNGILIFAIVLITVAAAGTLIKRRGRRGCCGSAGDYKPRKKKLKTVIATKAFTVEGMHCENCANRVTMAVNDIPDVAGVVDLKKGVVTVSYAREVPDALIQERIQRHGYTVTKIR